mgnify:CR=1 FL=1
MNHGDRTLPAPAVSEAEAAPRWTAPSPVLAHQLALDPHRRRVRGAVPRIQVQNASGGHVLVYVDAPMAARSAFSCSRRTRMGRW